MQFVQLLTVGRIAELLKTPSYKVRRVIQSNPDIQPVAIADNRKVFDAKAMARIRYCLTRETAVGGAEL